MNDAEMLLILNKIDTKINNLVESMNNFKKDIGDEIQIDSSIPNNNELDNVINKLENISYNINNSIISKLDEK